MAGTLPGPADHYVCSLGQHSLDVVGMKGDGAVGLRDLAPLLDEIAPVHLRAQRTGGEHVKLAHHAKADDVATIARTNPAAPQRLHDAGERFNQRRIAKRNARRQRKRVPLILARYPKVLRKAAGLDLRRPPGRALNVLSPLAGAALEARRVVMHEDPIADRER